MGENNTAQESWNMGTETLKRLARCLDMSSFYSQQQDVPNWYYVSLDLKRNLRPFLTEEEFGLLMDKLKEFPPMIGGKIQRQDFNKSYICLDNFYMLAVTYMKSKGLLMPKVTDPRAAVINN